MKELQANEAMEANSDLSRPGPGFYEYERKIREGNISAYAEDIELGIIKTNDHKKFIFAKADWLAPETKPAAGTQVSFEAVGSLARKVRIAD